MGQRYVAEFVGTFGLLLSVTGAAPLSLNHVLGTFSFDARVLLIGCSLGFGVMGPIYCFDDISEVHFDLVVTIAIWVAGRANVRAIVPYIVAQVLRGIVAVGTIAAGLTGF